MMSYDRDVNNEMNGEEKEEMDEDMDSDGRAIRSELSHMTFEEILKLKDKLGSKVYSEALSGKRCAQTKANVCYKRENKNRPREMSSKTAVSHFRPVYHKKKDSEERRDPRFEERCGAFDESIFRKTYSFLDDIKEKERKQLRRELKKTDDENRRKDIHYLLQRMDNQKKAEQEKLEKIEIKKKVKDLVNADNHEKQIFVNKSTLKRVELVEKFKKLKKSGKLEKYLQTKRKRNATRERKKISNK